MDSQSEIKNDNSIITSEQASQTQFNSDSDCGSDKDVQYVCTISNPSRISTHISVIRLAPPPVQHQHHTSIHHDLEIAELERPHFSRTEHISYDPTSTAGLSTIEMSHSSWDTFSETQEQFRFTCYVCEQQFKFDEEYKSHLSQHDNSYLHHNYECQWCLQTFKEEVELKTHNCTNMKDDSGYNCTICYRKFSRRPGFLRHMETHIREKQHKCANCREYFLIKPSKKTLQREYLGEIQYLCHTCSQPDPPQISDTLFSSETSLDNSVDAASDGNCSVLSIASDPPRSTILIQKFNCE